MRARHGTDIDHAALPAFSLAVLSKMASWGDRRWKLPDSGHGRHRPPTLLICFRPTDLDQYIGCTPELKFKE
jgi:hypothetical protein